LDPADVSVLDTRGNLLSRRKPSPDDGPDIVFERRQRLEHDLLDKVNTTLEPLLGRDKFRAAVTVDCDLTTAEQDEETYDPTKSVMTASKKTEEVMTGNSNAGIPGTASNLPRPAARIGGPSNMTTRRSEDINYESSHLVRKTHIPDGGIRRMSVSVLLDQHIQWEGKGSARHAVPIPPSPDTLKAVHDLIAGVTGFVQERGDQITVESLPFEATLEQQPPNVPAAATPGKTKPFNIKDLKDNKMLLIAAAAGAGVILLLLGTVVFLVIKNKKRDAAEQKGDATEADVMPAVEDAKPKAALDAADEAEAALAERIAEQHKQDMAALAALKLPAVTTKKSELLTKEIQDSTKKDPAVPAHVIQTWIHES
jgi:flagellar M-ring protein FliF